MTNAKRDENDRPTIIAASKNNGTTVILATANPSTHALSTEDGTTGSDNGNNQGKAMLDESGVAVWMALSSALDGTLVEVYADPANGSILIDSM